MPYERPGNAVRVTASVPVRHGALALDDDWVGRVIKTETPGADTPRADRNLVAAGEGYNLRPRGVAEVPTTGLAGAEKGDIVYIDESNALHLTAAAGRVAAGKITHLPGEQGTPADRLRVDLEQKG
jgi:predicted RecA/RadA family phage recombinase